MSTVDPRVDGPVDEPALESDAALVGAGWTQRYRARFAELAQGGPLLRWNSEAAFTPLWGFKRRIPVLIWLAFLFPALGVALSARGAVVAGFTVPTAAFVLLHGWLGDWMLFRRVRRRAARLAAMPDDAVRRAALERSGQTGWVEYALLVALLLPLSALVILAANLRMRGASEARPFVAVLDGDLRRLVAVQEEYFADVGRYAEAFGPWSFAPSPGVNLRILYADSLAFGADATLGGREERCFVFLGEARAMPEGGEPGTPLCTVERR